MLMPNCNFDELSLGDNDNCIITGGHFRIFFENDVQAISLNTGTIMSFESAVKLYL